MAVDFAPIHQLRAHEYVADQIRRHIALRLIGPGESLPSERELAAMFGVGRPTIQHAMRLLEADRLVHARRGRGGGTFVVERVQDAGAIDELLARVLRERDEIEELLVFRRALEPRVAWEAARAREEDDLTAIWEAIDGMSNAAGEPEYMRHDTELHLAIARASRNRFMLSAIEEIRMGLNDVISLLPESDTWHRRLRGEHEGIADAIDGRACEAARDAMERHLTASERGVRALLSAMGRRMAP